jgi:hypothetical protein
MKHRNDLRIVNIFKESHNTPAFHWLFKLFVVVKDFPHIAHQQSNIKVEIITL